MIFAQIVFGFLVAIAVLTARLPTAKVSRQLARWSLVLAAIMFGQVVFGTLIRHGPTPLTQRLHFLTAFLATALAVWLLLALAADSAAYAGFVRGVGAGGSHRTSACARRRGMDGEVWDVYPSRSSHNHAVERSDSNRARGLVGTLVLATTVGLAIRLRQPVAGKISTQESANAGWYQPPDTATRSPAITARLGGDSA